MNSVLDLSVICWIGHYIMLTIGYWLIFKKCGIKSFWGLVPTVREYLISVCADKEKDGRVYAVFSAITYLTKILMVTQDDSTRIYAVLAIVYFTLELVIAIYMIRIYLGLIDVFGQKKRWIIAFVFFEGIAVLVWGLSPKYMPLKQVDRIDESKSAKESGHVASSTDNDLTVNIDKRVVIDFFKKRYLLKDIHMSIPKGHMVLLLGGSGAGKTTFVNAVTGYEKADAKIELGDRDVYREYEGMKYDIGFVPQQDLMRGNDTVLRTLMDAATLRLPSDISRSDKRARVNDVLEQFGLFAIRRSLVEKLSGGQRKRLSIAMEFISDPSLFILDEPDSGLDGVVARGLFEKLRAIADEGKIVIVITHTPDRVIDLFDDVIVLAKDNSRTGRLAWYGPVNEAYVFFDKESMEEILLSINQKEEGGEGRANEFVEKYEERLKETAV